MSCPGKNMGTFRCSHCLPTESAPEDLQSSPLRDIVREAILGAALLVMLAGCGRHEAPEIRIAVGGAEQFVYLPTTLAQQLGFYEAEGVAVKLESFPGGAKSLQALLGG